MRAFWTVLALLGVMTGCDRSSPTEPAGFEPAPDMVTDPLAPTQESWSLDWYLESVRGDVPCWIEHDASLVGTGAQGEPLQIKRESGRISLTYLPDDPFAGMLYEGTLDGKRFTAEGPTSTLTFECHDGSQFISELSIRVTGRFAPDGRSLEAEEKWVYRVDSATRVVYSYPWNAVRVERR